MICFATVAVVAVRGGKKIYEAEKASDEQFQAHAIFRAIGSGSHKSHMGDSGEVQTESAPYLNLSVSLLER